MIYGIHSKAVRTVKGIIVSLLLLGSSNIALQGTISGKAEAATLPEFQVTPSEIIDYEFDWGRDGVYCPTCNFGAGNARLTFTDRDYNVWVGSVDFNTGAFYPPDGHGVLVDTGGAFATDFGNGPEWMFSTDGTSQISQIVYTKYAPNAIPSTFSAGVAIAAMKNGAWSGQFISNGMKRQSPMGTLDLDDPAPRINYQDYAKKNIYWKTVGQPSSEQLVPIGNQTGGGSRRWVPGTHKIIFSGSAPPDSTGQVYQQVFVYDTDAQTLEQLTFDPVTKWGAFMWKAPEFNNEYVFLTISGRTNLSIYRQLPDPQGVLKWTEFNRIAMPATLPYAWSPELFVHNGRSFVFFQISSSSKANDMSVPTQLAMTGIDPAKPSFRMLTNDNSIRRVRMDPEYFITAQGPFIYYNRYIPQTDTRKSKQDGVWRVDTGLGPAKTP